MSEIINLDQNQRQVVRGLANASSVICTATSATDVYVHVITRDDTAELYRGDGTVIPKMTRTRFYIFRRNSGNAPFSATISVTDLPAAAGARADVLMSAFSLVKHKPGGIKPTRARKASKKKRAKKRS